MLLLAYTLLLLSSLPLTLTLDTNPRAHLPTPPPPHLKRSKPHLKPITLSHTGGFQIGGRTTSTPGRPNSTLTCDHAYVESFIPFSPRSSSFVLWHSSSTQVFQNRWDGGPGLKDLLLRRQYPVYLWDGPRVGRANWGCEPYSYIPRQGSDQANFVAWNFGPSYGVWWNETQFPRDDERAWIQATSARYQEFDTDANVQLHSDVAAVAADSGRLGRDIVYVTNSAGGLRAQLTITKAERGNVRAIVAYESIGFVFPDTYRGGNGTGNGTGFAHVPGFGPFVVPEREFAKLADLEGIQFVWGDHRDDTYTYVQQSRIVARLINEMGGNAEVVMLGEKGLKGSTHIAFADMDNEKVVGLLEEFLEDRGLDSFVDEKEEDEEVEIGGKLYRRVR